MEYTEIVIICELINPLPDQIIKTLRWLCGETENGPVDNTDEDTKYFWEGLLAASHEDCFPVSGRPTLYFSELFQTYHLFARTVIKNHVYEGQRFLHWIAPYTLTEGFVGYMRNEGFDIPTLIYIKNNKGYLVDISEQQWQEITF